MKATVERISPTKARQYLKNSDNIRKPNRNKIKLMARDMRSEHWEDNGESIKFASNGSGDVLRDGQNRLHAIIESRTTQQMLVVRGIADSEYVDVGERRTLAQLLRHDGIAYASNIAAITANLLNYQSFLAGIGHPAQGISHSQRIDTFKRHRKPLQKWAAEIHNSRPRPRWCAAIAVPCILGSCPRGYAAAKEEWVYYLSTGEDLQSNDACFVLRETMLEAQRKKIRWTPRKRLGLVIKAWNYHREQMLLPSKTLSFVETGPTAEEFPKIR